MRPILLIEDDEPVVRALKSLLGDEGFDVTAFGAGLPALEHASRNRPLAALIDIHLPDVNGLVLTAQLRQRLGPDVPLVVLSGDTSMENINSLSFVGATYFFAKPIDPKELLKRLGEWIK